MGGLEDLEEKRHCVANRVSEETEQNGSLLAHILSLTITIQRNEKDGGCAVCQNALRSQIFSKTKLAFVEGQA